MRHRPAVRPRPAAIALALAAGLGCHPASTFVAHANGGPDGPASGVEITVRPHDAYAVTGGTVRFSAALTGPAEAVALGAEWMVQEGATGGTVGADGTYTAPQAAGTYHVVATARADRSQHDSASILVSPRPTTGRPAAMPVISRGAPTYSSTSYNAASNATDADYSTSWMSRGDVPAWVAVDLSAAPATSRGAVVVVWYNAPTWGYDATVLGGQTYSLVGAYTIDAHAAAGGGAPPDPADAGWVTLATVTGNELSSRQHLVDLGGRNWVRIRVTAPCERNANSPATEVSFNLDVHDAHLGAQDDWLFVGDSITAGAWWRAGYFGQGINATLSDHFPAAQNAGIGYQTAASTVPRMAAWLALFPGRYVGLSFGTNDGNGNLLGTPQLDAFQASYASLVQAVLDAGKIPVVPTIIWSGNTSIQANLPAMNQRLAALRTAYPQIVNGPDLYAAFQGRTDLFNTDGIHPNDAGSAELRLQWIQAMLANVYP